MKQCTLKQPVTVSGVGLHTGVVATLTFKPAEVNFGYKFQRVDLQGSPVIPCDCSKVVSTRYNTTIQQGIAQVSTIEHALSALRGLEIDNVLMEINAIEVPILDGSAAPFVKALLSAGIVEQDAEREYFVITHPIIYRDEATDTELLALPDTTFNVTANIDFDSPVLGQQYARMKSLEQYATEIAPARTFTFVHDLEKLLAQNLIKGGDLDNAVVIAEKAMSQVELSALATKLGKKTLEISKAGVLNTAQLRFENEPSRHKLLDVIGDLALVGKPIQGKIVASKPGHTANVAFAKLLKKEYLDWKKIQEVPKYDPNLKSVMDVNAIMKKIPHRYPFLLVDKVVEVNKNYIVSIKNVTMNEPFFQGHFPGNPVFPGVLQLEAMAQTGGLFVLQDIPDGEIWDTYFLKIDGGKFRDKVFPGDTMVIKMELLSPMRRGIALMRGTAYVGNRLVSEAELTAFVQKRG
jgi:UDP-3-O-[3-hydroxymyristoyl] N-acetylglucosamine deacetylase / 3-hydroxyacyl-[acyl-carrier-protein] dehydratase